MHAARAQAGCLKWALPLVALALSAAPALGQTAVASGAGGVPLPAAAEGVPISRVDVALVDDAGTPARASAFMVAVRTAFSEFAGQPFSRYVVEQRLRDLRTRLGAPRLSYRLTPGGSDPGSVVLRVEVDASAAPPGAEDAPGGVIAGKRSDFPTLYRTNRSLVSGIVTGGFGFYGDVNPWFGQPALFTRGSPIASRRPGPRIGWTEGFVEYGIGGATQVGDLPIYVFGALTGLTSWSLGQDIYRNEPRAYTAVEKAYAGFIYASPHSRSLLTVSLGRQNVTLNDGFLIHFVRGSANIDRRGGTYLGPRNANDFSAVAHGRLGSWVLSLMYIDPNEFEPIESNSTFAVANLKYEITPKLEVDASYIAIPRSDSSYAAPGGVRLPREGLRTVAGHMRWRDAFGVNGLWLASEYAHQSHDSFSMSAWAAYGLIGYIARDLPWTPSLSYRYAHASGDDPDTGTYERFDPLLSTGLGNWLQGISFGKVVTNSNLAVHRLQFNLAPTPALNLTFDWHWLRAPERNNLGGNPALAQLSSRDLGQEYTLTARWAITRHWYLQSLASVAVPGKALRAVGADKPWTTLQASFYWSF